MLFFTATFATNMHMISVHNEVHKSIHEQNTTVCGGLKGSLIEEPGAEHSPHHEVSAVQRGCHHRNKCLHRKNGHESDSIK